MQDTIWKNVIKISFFDTLQRSITRYFEQQHILPLVFIIIFVLITHANNIIICSSMTVSRVLQRTPRVTNPRSISTLLWELWSWSSPRRSRLWWTPSSVWVSEYGMLLLVCSFVQNSPGNFESLHPQKCCRTLKLPWIILIRMYLERKRISWKMKWRRSLETGNLVLLRHKRQSLISRSNWWYLWYYEPLYIINLLNIYIFYNQYISICSNHLFLILKKYWIWKDLFLRNGKIYQ